MPDIIEHPVAVNFENKEDKEGCPNIYIPNKRSCQWQLLLVFYGEEN